MVYDARRTLAPEDVVITLKSFVQGQWIEGRGDFATLVNPATEVALAHTSTTGIDFAAALDYARREGGPALRALTFAQRGALLKRMSKVLFENAAKLYRYDHASLVASVG